MNPIRTIAALALASLAWSVHAADTLTVTITASDTLKFDVSRIEAAPGQNVRVILRNAGSLPKSVMGHNWVLLKAGGNATTYSAQALSAKAEGYEPKRLAGQVLAAIPLVGGGETGEVRFRAPLAPGKYPFLCSSPAHFAAGMRGVLVVK